MRGTRVAGILAAATLAVGASACGDDDSDAPDTQAGVTETSGGQTDTAGASEKPRLEKVGDFDQPVFVAQRPGSEDLYVVEQGGTVQRVAPDGTASPALDITGEVTAGGEQGLLSIAFDPDGASNLVYAYYTDRDQKQNVAEYEVSEDGSIDPGSRREVLVMDDFAANHNGGLLMFGPDGLLYIGTGDGGIADDPERNGQDLQSLLGKILRIDPHRAGGEPYTPKGAPSLAGRAAPEVYSYGLRNPWRFSFDRETGALSIGDVGQNEFEEIDFVESGKGAGANFGWSAFEGDQRFNEDQEAPDAVPPVLTYGRDAGCSVTGGYVVRDPGLPALEGRYLYGDFCAGDLRSFVPGPGRASGDRSTGLEVPNLSSFAEGLGGEVYATSLDGPVFRIVQ